MIEYKYYEALGEPVRIEYGRYLTRNPFSLKQTATIMSGWAHRFNQ